MTYTIKITPQQWYVVVRSDGLEMGTFVVLKLANAYLQSLS